MPEIAEVARITHFLRLHLVGRKIGKVTAADDQIVYGKVGTTGSAFERALKGKTVVSAGSQGKYFWLTLDKPPHPVMHFGMTGWIHIKGEKTAYTNYYKKQKPEEMEAWPPRFWKFHLATTSTSASPVVEVAFTDPRRLGRIRLVDCPGPAIRSHTPLLENGPDPVVDLDTTFTSQFFATKLRSKRVPIKSLLLDQANISGIGNWVGDEVLYHARVHPEHYSHELDEAQIKALYAAVVDVCKTSCDVLGDSDQFPQDWLFHYRWGKGKGKSGAGTLPSGEKLAFVTVGGRTSCYCPALQKKGGAGGAAAPAPKTKAKRKREHEEEPELKDDEDEDEGEEEAKPVPKKSKRSARTKAVKEDSDFEEEQKQPAPAKSSRRTATSTTGTKTEVVVATKKTMLKREKKAVAVKEEEIQEEQQHPGHRRSVRLRMT